MCATKRHHVQALQAESQSFCATCLTLPLHDANGSNRCHHQDCPGLIKIITAIYSECMVHGAWCSNYDHDSCACLQLSLQRTWQTEAATAIASDAGGLCSGRCSCL